MRNSTYIMHDIYKYYFLLFLTMDKCQTSMLTKQKASHPEDAKLGRLDWRNDYNNAQIKGRRPIGSDKALA